MSTTNWEKAFEDLLSGELPPAAPDGMSDMSRRIAAQVRREVQRHRPKPERLRVIRVPDLGLGRDAAVLPDYRILLVDADLTDFDVAEILREQTDRLAGD